MSKIAPSIYRHRFTQLEAHPSCGESGCVNHMFPRIFPTLIWTAEKNWPK